jgi:hypothetical protein
MTFSSQVNLKDVKFDFHFPSLNFVGCVSNSNIDKLQVAGVEEGPLTIDEAYLIEVHMEELKKQQLA